MGEQSGHATGETKAQKEQVKNSAIMECGGVPAKEHSVHLCAQESQSWANI